MVLENVEQLQDNGEEDFRVFRATGKDLSVHIDAAALRNLERMVRESVNAIRGHGVEMGGLILGQPIDCKSGKLVITGFTQVEIEYRFGPSFRTSPADIDTFKNAVAKCHGTAIGSFRSQVRTGMLVREDDYQLTGALFGDRPCCFAPIEATVNSPSMFSLYVGAGGAPVLLTRFPVKQSVVESARIDTAETQSWAEQPSQGGIENAAPLSLERAPAREIPEEAAAANQGGSNVYRDYRWAFALATAGLAVIASAFYLGKQYGSRSKTGAAPVAQNSSSTPDNTLRFRIVANRSTVEIRWNQSNPDVSSAARGLLVLFNGPEPKRVDLSQTEVRSGAYSFPARNSKISAWLTIYQANGSFIGDTKEVVLPIASAKPLVSESASVPRQNVNTPIITTPTLPATEPSPLTSNSDATRPREKDQTLPPPEPIRVTEAPPPPAMQPVVIPAFPPPQIGSPEPLESGLNYKGSIAPLTPARLLHQAVPAVPVGVGARLRAEVQLDVAVTIDAAGRVTGARVVSSQGAFASLLTIEVLKAANFSRFTPAQERGRPVEGSAILTFRFKPKSN